MLPKKILHALEQREDIGQRVLSQVAGVNESTISRYLHGYEELNFESALKIVKLLFPDQEKELMQEYVLTQKSRNARYALEYCTMNRLPAHCEQIIDILASSSNPIDKEWATLYRFTRIQNQQQLHPLELLKQIEIFNPKQLEVQILKTIIKAYIFVELNDYQSLKLYMKDIEISIANVKSSFMQNCLNIRVGLIMNYATLYGNDIPKARHYSHLVINQHYFPHVKALAFHHLGHSYLFEDYKKANQYLSLAYKSFIENNNETLAYSSQLTLSFIQSYWRIERDFPFELKGHKEKTEYIYYLIQLRETDQAKQVMDEIDVKDLSNWSKGFYYYFQGLLSGEKDAFYHSVDYFRRAGDAFHRRLPIDELKRMNENAILIKIFSN
ncbi:AimR family lysis-lysogeny pheromone receptor [Bacillus horti]|uniref:Plasmid maintenance system antidote protein VapI n=1 Tax=Caldalkalibacillus horti TaxID=77523 RepID=A0ABT9W2T6_9BACI|nr:AimR family lysis-lysogeny pheromone receptor [Bacillus horti]MDQ0167551.1 plasmid maintenance system antidote protein VapI [Bacillus horti]